MQHADTFARSIVANTLHVTPYDVAAALQNLAIAPRSCHADSHDRRAKRRFLDGAGVMHAQVTLAFLKVDGSMRYMVCEPVPGVDATGKYVTVQDLELTALAGRPKFRRVCLDTIVKMDVSYAASGLTH